MFCSVFSPQMDKPKIQGKTFIQKTALQQKNDIEEAVLYTLNHSSCRKVAMHMQLEVWRIWLIFS
ncbi:hypothetical protein CRM81_13945 [Yersinia kristensenii]|nr:hypothetical protein CRM81_13945 [Yersinia kristensenii]